MVDLGYEGVGVGGEFLVVGCGGNEEDGVGEVQLGEGFGFGEAVVGLEEFF